MDSQRVCRRRPYVAASISRRGRIVATACLASLWLGPDSEAAAADLRADTVAAFERYVQLTEARMMEETAGRRPFLWLDRQPEPDRREVTARLRRGEIVVNRMETRDAGRLIQVPGGICHHWLGTVFAPDAALARTAALMQSYDSYPDIYRPAVRRSRTISRDGDRFNVYLQLFMKKVISVVLNTEYDVQYVPIPPNRMVVRSYATRIAEVQHPDTAEEQEKPVGHDSGFLWRFDNYCGLEERDGGTYIQCESISLSRDVPSGLGWLIRPFVTGIPRESLEFTLRTIRTALSKPR
jgi:hypothetical protein